MAKQSAAPGTNQAAMSSDLLRTHHNGDAVQGPALGEIEVRGHKYRAVEAAEPGRCGNCAFKNGFGCTLAEVKGNALSFCSGEHRPDGKYMNFLPAHQA